MTGGPWLSAGGVNLASRAHGQRKGGRASALRRVHRDSTDRGAGWAGGALAQRSGPRTGWKGEGIGLDPGEGKWAGELLGPRGKKRRGAGLGCFWGLGWLGFLVPSLF